ncbi:hypothetical protein [Streptomyces lunalinharesii]|uniref:hypothetical protein n=1 Tax=Streptomyces lunalinharesii TaxID=333384 RepID=UPI0031DAE5A4
MPVSRARKKKQKKQSSRPKKWKGLSLYGLGMEAQTLGTELSSKTKEAGHRATENDRLWFDKHPGQSVRVREAFPDEHDEHLLLDGRGPLTPNEKLAVVVVQIQPGCRTRLPYSVIKTDTPGGRLTQQQLDAVQQDWENSDQTAPVLNAQGQKVDMLQLARSAVTGTPTPT